MRDLYFETLMKCITEIKVEIGNIKEDIVKINESIIELKKENDNIKNNSQKKKKWFLF
jgi:hypothetical protein